MFFLLFGKFSFFKVFADFRGRGPILDVQRMLKLKGMTSWFWSWLALQHQERENGGKNVINFQGSKEIYGRRSLCESYVLSLTNVSLFDDLWSNKIGIFFFLIFIVIMFKCHNGAFVVY